MREPKPIDVRFPKLGLHKRLALAEQPRDTTFDCLNVYPDGAMTERERGGMRRGMAKFSATQLGSGNKIRLMGAVRCTINGVVVTRLVVSANGVAYVIDPSGTVTTISSSTTLASDRQLMGVDFGGLFYVADHGPTLESGSDGVISGGSFNQLTSTAAGDFAAGGVNDDDHAVYFERHDAIDCVQTVTISGTPTGGVFILRDPDSNTTTIDIAYNAAASVVEDALEGIYGAGNVGVTGSGGGPYTVTFQGDCAGKLITLMEADGDYLTGGTSPDVAVAMTTKGATTTTYAGTYNITTVATTTVTIGKTLVALTGVVFKIARCPKKIDPVANTLTKWIQDDYSLAEAVELGDPDLSGTSKGAIPLGRSIIAVHFERIYMAGGLYSPNTLDCSRIGDAGDWDYGQADVARAVSGSTADAGRISAPITALVPHQASCLLIASAGQMFVLRGDITAGEIPNLTDHVGILDRFAWCRTAQGVIVFLSTNGVYGMPDPCGGRPTPLSKPVLPQEFRNVDISSYTVSLEYCHDMAAVILFISQNSASAAGVAWFLDVQLSVHNDGFGAAFFPQTLADEDFEPFTLHAWRDLISDHSNVMFGCRDGYVRRMRRDLAQDDGSNFASYVKLLIQPAHSNQSVAVNEIYASIPASSGDIDWTLYVASSAELAIAAASAATGEWNTVGRTPSVYPRVSGNALVLKLANGENNVRWEIESVGMTLMDAGRVRP